MLLRQQEIPITQLVLLLPYNSFGGWLKTIREKYHLTQKQIAEVSEPYLLEAGAQALGRRIVSTLENDNRFPLYKELEPLYRCLVDKDGFALSLSADERDLYIYFARKRIEGPHIPIRSLWFAIGHDRSADDDVLIDCGR